MGFFSSEKCCKELEIQKISTSYISQLISFQNTTVPLLEIYNHILRKKTLLPDSVDSA